MWARFMDRCRLLGHRSKVTFHQLGTRTWRDLMTETMDDRYGDDSDHLVCQQCGLCITCGDCRNAGCGEEVRE